MNLESGRVANVLAQARMCAAADALARARSLRGSGGCVSGSCAPPDSTIKKPVPQSSTDLNAKVANCPIKVQGPEYGVPESVRIARLEQRSRDLSIDATNPLARFSEYRRPFIPICPPIPQWYYTAGEPVLQGPCKIGTTSAEEAISFSKNPNNTVPS